MSHTDHISSLSSSLSRGRPPRAAVGLLVLPDGGGEVGQLKVMVVGVPVVDLAVVDAHVQADVEALGPDDDLGRVEAGLGGEGPFAEVG